MRTKLAALTVATLVTSSGMTTAAFDGAYVIHKKHAPTVSGYFSTAHQIKAKNYWEQYQIIDATTATTIPVATQVEFAAGSETADVYVPGNYEADKPVGIYIHMNAGDTAYMPGDYQGLLNDLYCIGASPDHAGNERHDPWRIARALDLVASLKDQYNVDEDRIYIGGFSGGALISILSAMIYPDVFKGVAPTEHVMYQQYWGKVFTAQDITEMVANNQRYAFIIAADYAAWWFTPKVDTWRNLGFAVQQTTVPGMVHQQPFSSDLKNAIAWIDIPAQRQRATTFESWNSYAYSASNSTSQREPGDDFDNDSIDNWTEYMLGLNPTVADKDPRRLSLFMDGTEAKVRYRRAAIDARLQVDLSPDLASWDETGNQVSETSVSFDTPAIATCGFTASTATAPKLFFRARAAHVPLVNLTQLAGVSALQATTGWDGNASLAIDGNTDPVYENGSVTHTDLTSANWWRVHLGTQREIYRVTLHNRSVQQARLSNIRIAILNGSGVEVAGKNFFVSEGYAASQLSWDLPVGTLGTYVRVTSLGNNRDNNRIISLAECEVIGPDPT